MAAAKSATETAVRSYLLYLEDPAALRDESAIAQHSKAVANATDPIDKLKALAALESVSTIDEAPLRAGFVRMRRHGPKRKASRRALSAN